MKQKQLSENAKKSISKYLIQEGWKYFNAPRKFLDFTDGNKPANEMINDIENQPHSFVIACLMDTQIKAERAWQVPYELKHRMGFFDFETLKTLSQGAIRRFMSEPTCLHRYKTNKADCLYELIHKIEKEYDGDVSNIWQGEPSSAEVVHRFIEFKGFGQKLANMAANILAREFKVPFSDYRSIDISADRHVQRVLSRLGMVPMHPSPEQIIYTAREIAPEYPGIVDLPLFYTGRDICHPTDPECQICPLVEHCAKVI